jgi:hypothetical protein
MVPNTCRKNISAALTLYDLLQYLWNVWIFLLPVLSCITHLYDFWFHLEEMFHRTRLKCEKSYNEGWRDYMYIHHVTWYKKFWWGMKRLHTPCHVIQKVIMRDEETTHHVMWYKKLTWALVRWADNPTKSPYWLIDC